MSTSRLVILSVLGTVTKAITVTGLAVMGTKTSMIINQILRLVLEKLFQGGVSLNIIGWSQKYFCCIFQLRHLSQVGYGYKTSTYQILTFLVQPKIIPSHICNFGFTKKVKINQSALSNFVKIDSLYVKSTLLVKKISNLCILNQNWQGLFSNCAQNFTAWKYSLNILA